MPLPCPTVQGILGRIYRSSGTKEQHKKRTCIEKEAIADLPEGNKTAGGQENEKAPK